MEENSDREKKRKWSPVYFSSKRRKTDSGNTASDQNGTDARRNSLISHQWLQNGELPDDQTDDNYLASAAGPLDKSSQMPQDESLSDGEIPDSDIGDGIFTNCAQKQVAPSAGLLAKSCQDVNSSEENVPNPDIGKDNEYLSDGEIPDSDVEEETNVQALSIRIPIDSKDINDVISDTFFPTKENLMVKPTINKNKIEGSYTSVGEYLHTQYFLLKEDYIQPLRKGIREFQEYSMKIRRKTFKSRDIRVIRNARIIEKFCGRSGILYRIQFEVQSRSQLPRRFTYGTLICLWEEREDKLLFATVANMDERMIKRGIIEVKFEGESISMVKEMSEKNKFYMIESKGFYESYRHVLQGIKQFAKAEMESKEQSENSEPQNMDVNQKKTEINSNFWCETRQSLLSSGSTKKLEGPQSGKLPFQKYIVHADRTAEPPKYLQKGCSSYDLSTLHPGCTEEINVFKTWPDARDLGLDEAQLEALKYAFTHELALIQGPPGCGKTFLGLKIVDVLLQNQLTWLDPHENNNPILVVCYTNHALDQFLKGVHDLKNSMERGSYPIVRVGSRCTEESLEPYLLKNIKKSQPKRRKYGFSDKDYRDNIEHYKQCLEDSLKGIVRIGVIKAMLKQKENKMENVVYSQISQLMDNNGSYGMERLVEWLEPWRLVSDGSIYQSPLENQQIDQDISDDESFDEIDVEYENRERMLDEEFDDFQVSEHPSILIEERQLPTIPFSSLIPEPLTNHEMYRIGDMDIWRLDFNTRWSMYLKWIAIYRNKLQEKLSALFESYQEVTSRLQEENLSVEENIFRKAKVLGMTTTAAGRYSSVLQRVAPKIVIIEEAAEVLEGHVITSLSAGCQHLILIGDHQQLRPKPTTYAIAEKYKLGVSLFERLINNNIPYRSLVTQHRMRPIIASLLVPHIYQNLEDGAKVMDYKDIRGVKENMFFLDHSQREDKMKVGTSRTNTHEARFLVAFAFYLQHQGYKASEITIVTAYKAQASLIRKIFKTEAKNMLINRKYFRVNDICEVHVTPIDNYQGEENEIILLSLVRSNKEENLGFMEEFNRICVGLSRAKQGFYAVGDFSMAERCNEKWRDIIEDVREKGKIGKSLVLQCNNHKSQMNVATAEDFQKTILICSKICGFRMDCGHVCSRDCHSDDLDHSLGKERCRRICLKPCSNGHKCKRKCYQCSKRCTPCEKLVAKFLTKCQHEQRVECHLPEDKVTCKQPCEKVLDCGHKCRGKCYQCSKGCAPCRELVTKSLTKCQHKQKVECHLPEDRVTCKKPCEKTLECGHRCPAKCSEPCPPCEGRCKKSCPHGRCKEKCKDPCVPCKKPCKVCCKHKKCSKMCFENCKVHPCDEKCTSLVTFTCCKIEQKCIGLCGEPHPRCPRCNAVEIRERLKFFDTEDKKDASFIQLEDCKHIFEVKGLDQWMTKEGSEGESGSNYKCCPKCKTKITRSKRYSKYILEK